MQNWKVWLLSFAVLSVLLIAGAVWYSAVPSTNPQGYVMYRGWTGAYIPADVGGRVYSDDWLTRCPDRPDDQSCWTQGSVSSGIENFQVAAGTYDFLPHCHSSPEIGPVTIPAGWHVDLATGEGVGPGC